MSNIGVVLYDDDASDEKMKELAELMSRIVLRIDKAIKTNIFIGEIEDLDKNPIDECKHEFIFHKENGQVRCKKCPKYFPANAVEEVGKKT